MGNRKNDWVYRDAEKKIAEAKMETFLSLSFLGLDELPASFNELTHLQELNLTNNRLSVLPESLRQFIQLEVLVLSKNQLTKLPDWLGQFKQLKQLYLSGNYLNDLPISIASLDRLVHLDIKDNPLSPHLAAAYEQGLDDVKAYLRAKADYITLSEAKLILIGEGEVGKTCLLDALLSNPWQEHDSTHGIEIKRVQVAVPDSSKTITLNAWDFGGQRVYRPTHQLFFSAPAVYLVVWKPREGSQQGFVQEWIQLIKQREPEAKILVVATHGGPKQRKPDIDRQEIWDLFGKDTVLGFFSVDSRPDENGERRGIEELKQKIAEVAVELPEMGLKVPKSFQKVLQDLKDIDKAYLPMDQVMSICRNRKMDNELAQLFLTISHCLGHLIYFQHDPTLKDIVVLKPDWLATAISFVIDDGHTRKSNGLVHLSRLSELWDDPARPAEMRYPKSLHRVFLRLMERFDITYRAADPLTENDDDPLNLIAQLVDDTRPEEDLVREWPPKPSEGDIQQIQICCIVDNKGQSSSTEGLFYQLIVRLHKYSLGSKNHRDSVHWQRGLLLDDAYNGRALLEYIGHNVRITVRAPYPERFLAMLTGEVKFLVKSFWEGLHCNVMVPCVEPCGRNKPGTGLFNMKKLIDSKRNGRPDYPCPVCNEWQDIDTLLRNAPSASSVGELLADEMLDEIHDLRHLLVEGFGNLDANHRKLLSKVDVQFNDLLQIFTDEAKEGPRLFSLYPVDTGFLSRPKWISQKFQMVLWCEHSRLPVFTLGDDEKQGVYELDFPREWVTKATPFLKALTTTLSLMLPMAFSTNKLLLDDSTYKEIEKQLGFGKDCFDAILKGSGKISAWLGQDNSVDLPLGSAIRADGAILRELHTLLKGKDPGFGGLVRVMNKRREFLWVHPQFEKEY